MQRVEIRVRGQIDKDWSAWFDDFVITHCEENDSILAGTIADQSELYGLLAKLRDLGLALISVTHSEVE